VYVYNAALMCDDCGEKTRAELGVARADCRNGLCHWKGLLSEVKPDRNGWAECPKCGVDIVAETTADSDETPQYADESSSETDSLSMCDCGELIQEQLTTEGVKRLVDMLGEAITRHGDGGPAHETVRSFWRQVWENYETDIGNELARRFK
jgi:hypothetical protein